MREKVMSKEKVHVNEEKWKEDVQSSNIDVAHPLVHLRTKGEVEASTTTGIVSTPATQLKLFTYS